jgi:hypothetical protein
MITTRTHGIVDYVIGAVFFLAPYLFGFSELNFAHDVFTVLGLAIPGYSLLTNYGPSRLSILKAIPLNMHLSFDAAAGVFIVLAPWVYGYHDALAPFQAALHWILGLGTIALVALTGHEEEPRAGVGTPEGELLELDRPPSKKAA